MKHEVICRILGIMKESAQPPSRLDATGIEAVAADEPAWPATEEPEIIHLSLEDLRRIAEAILNPPEPNDALIKAARLHRELFGSE